MKKLGTIITLLLFLNNGFAQNTDLLKNHLEQIVSGKNADVGISIRAIEKGDTLNINGARSYPMLSVFKFPIALTVLHKVEEGEFSLDKNLLIGKEDLLPNTWSPFRDQFPEGNVEITLQEALEWMLVGSDNNITDVLIRKVGGAAEVSTFINSPDFVMKNNEEEMHKSWNDALVNTTTPNFLSRLLSEFYQGKLLNRQNTDLLFNIMLQTAVGNNRLKHKLPENTQVAHRPGTSFTNDEGLTGAINDIGIITLPDGNHIAISVFIHNTTEKVEDAENLIADIGKAVYDYYLEN